jgi:hypothetical protein
MLKKHAKMFNIGIDKHSTIPHASLCHSRESGNPEVFLHSHVNGNPEIKESGSPIKLGMTVE